MINFITILIKTIVRFTQRPAAPQVVNAGYCAIRRIMRCGIRQLATNYLPDLETKSAAGKAPFIATQLNSTQLDVELS